MNKRHWLPTILLLGVLLFALTSLAAQPNSLQAQGDPLPTATPFGTPPPTAVPPSPTGGTLILQTYEAPANSWTVVQWQDSNGGWHDVTSWQSQLTDGYVGWWVGPENLGAGPFRWLLLAGPDGEMLASSASFALPNFAGDVVLVEINLGNE